MRSRCSVILCLLAAVLVCATARSQNAAGHCAARLFGPGHTPTGIEGVWAFVGDRSAIAVKSNGTDTYDVYSLDSDNLRLMPMTVIGSAVNITPRGDKARMQLCTAIDADGNPSSPKTFVVSLDSDGNLSFQAAKTAARMDMWLLYRFFVSMSVHRNKVPREVHARRLWPDTTEPIIL